MALRLDIFLSGRLPRLPSYSKPNPSPPFASISMPSRSARRRVSGLEVELKKSWNRYRINCTAEGEGTTKSGDVKDKSVSVILLAGGVGKRMGAGTPKQYLPLLGQPIVYYSLQTFSQMKEVKEIVVVSDPDYRAIFEDARPVMEEVELKYALPGKERQDSVFSGFQEIDGSSELVCIHDSARPLISPYYIRKTLQDASLHGAAVLGVPVKSTIKEANKDSFVARTFDRRTLWEMQTPQVIKPELLRAGFELVNREGIQVTDDVSIVELLNQPVYITEGPYINIKITTPEDLLLAEKMMDEALEEARSKQLYQTYKQVPHFE